MPSHTTPTYSETTIDFIADEYRKSEAPWILGFSGGKDSSALLRLVYNALMAVKRPKIPVTVLYCDTGVEIPVVASFVRRTLRQISVEAKVSGLPLSTNTAKPRIEDSYFVKVIGRGYPPPTNKFRWCTNRLRIEPVQRAIARMSDRGALVLLGVRHGESPERDRTLSGLRTDRPYFLHQRGGKDTMVFAPILRYSTKQVWETLESYLLPRSLDAYRLGDLYRRASGECPIVRDPQGAPCGKGRFGCWTCTVVRKDRGLTGLTEDGYPELQPLLDFRNWLQEMRDETEYRCRRRRNGAPGPGPLTLDARQLILRKLHAAERKAGIKLIRTGEQDLIYRLWADDRRSLSYRNIERRRG